MKDNKDLMWEISTTEENIKTIENKLNNIKLTKISTFKMVKASLLSLLIATGFVLPVSFLEGWLEVKIVSLLCSLKFIGMSILVPMDYKKTNIARENIYNKSNELLNKTYGSEKEKLKNLNEIAKERNLEVVESTHKIRSEVISNLENKLKLIELYETSKKKILSYYKKGLMVEIMCLYDLNESDIRFIEELIKNDLMNLEEKENTNQKVKMIK
ncbi:MAG: hypothetical protein IJY25_06535 [Bacilli bacterium]|nr:hypothetical protein [Bacilli bacterium]